MPQRDADAAAFERMVFEWTFPLRSPQCGLPLANAQLGVLVWGGGHILNLSVCRPDCWDHAPGWGVEPDDRYAELRKQIERGEIKALYAEHRKLKTQALPPTILPLGRFEIDLGAEAELLSGRLDCRTGIAQIDFTQKGRAGSLRIVMDQERPAVALKFASFGSSRGVTPVPAWRQQDVREGKPGERPGLARRGFGEPAFFDTPAGAGWVQRCPNDPAICASYRAKGTALAIAVVRESPGEDALVAAARCLTETLARGTTELVAQSEAWWRGYWERTPSVSIPNRELERLYWLNMYKFAVAAHPQGEPCALQGPWSGDDVMVPWLGGYVFDLNLWMCYLPALHGNADPHCGPMFEMIERWIPLLKENARRFYGLEDAVHLPQKVDDRCRNMNPVPDNRLDVGLMAGWAASMMLTHYRFSMDRAFLERLAYPFMTMAMRVYESLLEREGESFVLPMARSPEYEDERTGERCWGRNPSIALALIHHLCEGLLETSAVLGKEPKPVWHEILARLPKGTVETDGGRERLSVMQGLPYEHSHRHFSHLSGIYPFDVFDLDEEPWASVARASMDKLVQLAPEKWCGYSHSWAAILHARMGNAEAAEQMLQVFARFFQNEGYGSMVYTSVPGYLPSDSPYFNCGEDMCLEGCLGAAAAVQQMLLHVRRGVTYLFRGAPRAWGDVAFQNMRTEGGFLLSAERSRGRVTFVRVLSTHGGELRLHNPWPGRAKLLRPGKAREILEGGRLRMATQRGEEFRLEPF